MVDVAIIGGGIAGCMAAHQLKKSGADIVLIERHAAVAQEASGNPAGLVMPQLSLGHSPAAQFNNQAYQAAIEFYAQCDIEKQYGILQLATSDEDEARFQKLSQQPNGIVFQHVDHKQARELLGLTPPRSALWFPDALTLSPLRLCDYLSQDVKKLLSAEVLSLQHDGTLWNISNGDCTITSARAVIVANAMDALRFPMTVHLKLRPRRGQLTFLPASDMSRNIRCNFTFGGYMTKAASDMHVLGATYEIPREDAAELTTAEHQKNLTKLHTILPDLFKDTDTQNLSGRAAVRATTPNHLPIYGTVENHENLYVLTGLGSRALTAAPLITDRIKALLELNLD